MRIVLLSPLPPPIGGIATWTKDFIEYSKKKNHEVYVVDTSLIGKRQNKKNHRKNFFTEIRRSLRIYKSLIFKINKYNPDYVYINSSCSLTGLLRDLFAVLISKNNKIVFHCHCDVTYQVKNKIAENLLKIILKNVSKVFVLNMQSLEYIKRLMDCDVRLIPNFIIEEKCDDYHKINEKVKKVVYVGHVRIQKGVREIIGLAKTNKDVQFDLAGVVTNEISDMEIPSNMHLLGAKESIEVKKLLETSDVFVFPSYTEGFSLALLEAMAVGLPVVATDVGANKDMIEDKGGIIVKSRSLESLSEAFTSIRKFEKRKIMSEWNINKVQKCYTDKAVISRIYNILKEN